MTINEEETLKIHATLVQILESFDPEINLQGLFSKIESALLVLPHEEDTIIAEIISNYILDYSQLKNCEIYTPKSTMRLKHLTEDRLGSIMRELIEKFLVAYFEVKKTYNEETSTSFPEKDYSLRQAFRMYETKFPLYLREIISLNGSEFISYLSNLTTMENYHKKMLVDIFSARSPSGSPHHVVVLQDYMVDQRYNVKTDFRKYIDYCFNEVYPPRTPESNVKSSATIKYYSPYFAVCQSSGMGKTRLILETAADNLPVIYMCFRAPLVQGEPVGSKKLYSFIIDQKNLKNGWLWCIFIMTSIKSMFLVEEDTNPLQSPPIDEKQRYVDIFSTNNKLNTFVNNSIRSEAFWERVIEAYRTVLTNIQHWIGDDSWLKAEEQDCNPPVHSLPSYFTLIQNVVFGNIPQTLKPPRVVIALDEAANLLKIPEISSATTTVVKQVDNFLSFRRALNLFISYSPAFEVMGILVDTNSRLTNFHPSVGADRSDRVNEGSLLLPPFIWFPTSLPAKICKYGNDRDSTRFQVNFVFSKELIDVVPTNENVFNLLACAKLNSNIKIDDVVVADALQKQLPKSLKMSLR